MRLLKFILSAIVGMVTPVEISGRAFFRVKLADFGVDVKNIPSACLDELADQAISVAKKVHQLTGRGLQNQVVIHVEGQAGIVSTILKTHEQRFFQDTVIPEFRERIGSVLERHGVHVPPP